MHTTRIREFERDGDVFSTSTGAHHGDPLVPSIEVMMKRTPGGRVTVFHVNAEQGNFWDKD